MAYLSKEAYAGKREYAAKRMAANKELGTLTEEQCDVLEDLCAFRHELHCNQESLFNSESSNFQRYAEMIGCNYSESKINANLVSVGLTPFLNHENECLPDDRDADGDEDYEELLGEVIEFCTLVNTEIENYLRSIDEKYGTDYAPTGATRL